MRTDEERLELLWRAHAAPVLAYCRRRLGTAEDAYDVTAEVFLTAWRHIAASPGDEGARLWLFTIASNALANHRRSTGRRSALAERLTSELPLPGQRSDQDHPGASGHAADDASDLVHRALARLSDSDRELIVLTTWDELSATDVARLLDISPTAARVRLHRARGRLRSHLQRTGLSSSGPPPAAVVLTSFDPTPTKATVN